MVADTVFGSGDNAVQAKRLGTELVSPVKGPTMEVEDVAPERRALTATDFAVDPNVEDPAVCPAGHFATEQIQRATQPNRVVLTFDRETCNACALLHACLAPLNEEGGRLRVARGSGGGQYRTPLPRHRQRCTGHRRLDSGRSAETSGPVAHWHRTPDSFHIVKTIE